MDLQKLFTIYDVTYNVTDLEYPDLPGEEAESLGTMLRELSQPQCGIEGVINQMSSCQFLLPYVPVEL